MRINRHYLRIAILPFLFSAFLGCSKFLDVEPVGLVIPNTVEQYRATLASIYNSMPVDLGKLELRTDDAQLSGLDATNWASYGDFYSWTDRSGSPSTSICEWKGYYHSIYIANYIIAHVTNFDGVDGDAYRQIVGEAYLLRAYSHFLLANIYAPPYSEANANTPAVPLVLDTETEIQRSRNTLAEVYQQIVADINKGRELMTVTKWPDAYTRYRFSRDAATAFACRVALYMGDWQTALNEGKAIADAYPLASVTDPASAPPRFNSPEMIMALDEAVVYSLYTTVRLSAPLLALFDKTKDQRFNSYFEISNGNYYVRRIGNVAEHQNGYLTTFRAAEVHLNMAEAAARLGQLAEAKTMLKGLLKTRLENSLLTKREAEIDTLASPEALLTEVLTERRRELAFSGLRWFDLRRNGQPAIEHKYRTNASDPTTEQTFRLEQNDARYTLPIPQEAYENNSNL